MTGCQRAQIPKQEGKQRLCKFYWLIKALKGSGLETEYTSSYHQWTAVGQTWTLNQGNQLKLLWIEATNIFFCSLIWKFLHLEVSCQNIGTWIKITWCGTRTTKSWLQRKEKKATDLDKMDLKLLLSSRAELQIYRTKRNCYFSGFVPNSRCLPCSATNLRGILLSQISNIISGHLCFNPSQWFNPNSSVSWRPVEKRCVFPHLCLGPIVSFLTSHYMVCSRGSVAQK